MKIITQEGFFEQNINKSRFLGFSYYVEKELDAQKIIKKIENKYCDCRHVVYAYKIQPNIEKKGNSSEPAGTAGAPIFSAIEKNDLTNVLVVIVRYFGGVLLGAQNLYRAYSTTALEVINRSKIKELQKYFVFNLSCDYSTFNQISSLANKYQEIKILQSNFNEKVEIELAIKEGYGNDYLSNLIKEQNLQGEENWL